MPAKSDQPWTELKGLTPSPFMVELLKTLEEAGFKNPVLHGGALRDLYAGREDQIHDYDVIANFGPDVPQQGNDAELSAGYRRFIADAIPGADKIDDVHIDRDVVDGAVFLGTEFEFQGRSVSLAVDPRNESFETSALFADAPINCIGMNSDGKIIAHKDFEDHVKNSVYAPFNGIVEPRARERFNHMAGKFPALTRGPSQDRPFVPPAPVMG